MSTQPFETYARPRRQPTQEGTTPNHTDWRYWDGKPVTPINLSALLAGLVAWVGIIYAGWRLAVAVGLVGR